MKILIKAPEKNTFRLRLPTALILNKRVLRFLLKYAGPETPFRENAEALSALAGEIRRLRKIHKHWTLLEVTAADGSRVEISF